VLDVLLLFFPIALAAYYLNVNPVFTFLVTAAAIIGISHLMAESSTIISGHVSATVSGLINATFGNALEFLIAIFALRSGLVDMVKASITGSIIVNVLLLVGLSMLMGGLKYKEQKFNKESAGLSSTMLMIAVIGLAMPSLYSMVVGKPNQSMSLAVSIILGVVYVLSLVYTLGTHRHLFVVAREATTGEAGRWSFRTAVIVLLVSTVAASFASDALVGSIKPLVGSMGLTQTFVGLVMVAIMTNIPEHVSAINFARRNNMTLSLEIGMSSALQIALFVVPVLVLASAAIPGGALDLVFSPFEMVAVIVTGMIANYIGSDGVCHWVEGVQLITVYLLVAVAFYFL
jgi:Ca2+:H+ antiporter